MKYSIRDIARFITEDPSIFNEGVQISYDTAGAVSAVNWDFGADDPNDIINLRGLTNIVYKATINGLDAYLAYEILGMSEAATIQVSQIQQKAANQSLFKKLDSFDISKYMKDFKQIDLDTPEYLEHDLHDVAEGYLNNVINGLQKLGDRQLNSLITDIKNIDISFEFDENITKTLFPESISVAKWRESDIRVPNKKTNLNMHYISQIIKVLEKEIKNIIQKFLQQHGYDPNLTKSQISSQGTALKTSGKKAASDLAEYLQNNINDPDVDNFINLAGQRLNKLQVGYQVILAGSPKALLQKLLQYANINNYIIIDKKNPLRQNHPYDIFDINSYEQDRGLQNVQPNDIIVSSFARGVKKNLQQFFDDGKKLRVRGTNRQQPAGYKIKNVIPTMRKYFSLYEDKQLPNNVSLLVDDTLQTGSTAKAIAKAIGYEPDLFALFATDQIALRKVPI